MTTAGIEFESGSSCPSPCTTRLPRLRRPCLSQIVIFGCGLHPKVPVLRHHCRARNWTFGEYSFLASFESSIWNGSMDENRLKKFRCEVGLKCHQSCLVALAFCTKLYRNWLFLCVRFLNFNFLLTFERLKPWSWNLAHFLSIIFSPIPC